MVCSCLLRVTPIGKKLDPTKADKILVNRSIVYSLHCTVVYGLHCSLGVTETPDIRRNSGRKVGQGGDRGRGI